jgi:hypothetical protein
LQLAVKLDLREIAHSSLEALITDPIQERYAATIWLVAA